MALVLDGNGSMTVGNGDIIGLTTGAIEPKAIGTGAVLQVVTASYASQTSTTSATFSDTGFSFSITPTTATSKILIMARVPTRTIGYAYGALQFVRGSSTILSPAPATTYEAGISTNTADLRQVNSYVYLDNPNTTSTVTYKIQMASWSNSLYEVFVSNNPASVVMMEVAG